MKGWVEDCSKMALQLFHANLDSYSTHPDASPFLGAASRQMYRFVREQLSVPFLRMDRDMTDDLSIGSFVTTIYRAIHDGLLLVPVMECLRAVIAAP
jgi:phenylalanine ammonia-lyase